MATRYARVGELLGRRRAGGARFDAISMPMGAVAAQGAACWDATRVPTTFASTPMPRVRTSPMRLTGASSIRFVVLMPDEENGDSGAGARLHRAGLDHDSARRWHRLHRRRDSADALSAVINTEKLERLGEVEPLALPGLERRSADDSSLKQAW
jgi:hypothetical protein